MTASQASSPSSTLSTAKPKFETISGTPTSTTKARTILSNSNGKILVPGFFSPPRDGPSSSPNVLSEKRSIDSIASPVLANSITPVSVMNPSNGEITPTQNVVASQWNITVTPRNIKSKKLKKNASRFKSSRREDEEESWTIYVDTEWGTLTLGRGERELVWLERELRSTLSPAILPTRGLSQLYSKTTTLKSKPSVRRNNVLATISRTLSPVRKSSPNTALSRIPSSGKILPLKSLNEPSASNSTLTSSDEGILVTPPPSSPEAVGQKDVFAANIVKSYTSPNLASTTSTNTSEELSQYLTRLSNIQQVRNSEVWKKFFATGREDLESKKSDKKVKRTRSEEGFVPHSIVNSANVPPVPALPHSTRINGEKSRTNESLIMKVGDEDGYDAGLGEDEARIMGLFPPTPPRTPGPQPSSSSDKMQVDERSPSDNISSNVQQQSEDQTVVLSAASSTRDEDSTQHTNFRAKSSISGSEIALTTSQSTIGTEAEGMETEIEEYGSERVEIPSRPKSVDPDENVRSSKIITVPTPPTSEKKKKVKMQKEKKKVTLDDFEIVKVLGKGCAGKVMLVRHSKTGGRYAMKAIHKHHVLAHRELQHTLTEQSVLKRVAKEQSNPFVVKLYWSFHDEGHLYLVLDFYPGGDLATQLARWGRLGRDRARFYAAEIVEGTVGLHKAGVIYRDLKPENILIAADGHIVLTDFGLSKQFERQTDFTSLVNGENGLPGPKPHWMNGTGGSRTASAPPANGVWMETKETTTTFCGTAEYLAPEVLLGEPYSYEVDWWSFGTMLFEMLTGLTPFWSEDHSTMYRRVLHDDLVFDEDSRVLDQDTKSLIRGLLQKVPGLRMTDSRIKRHPYFSMIDWSHVYHKRYIPPYIPTLDPHNEMDTQNFDETFLKMTPAVLDDETDGDVESQRDPPTGEPQAPVDAMGRDVFDGYSYLGRNDSASILIPDSDEDADADDNDDTKAHSSTGVNDTFESAPADVTSSSMRTESTGTTSIERETNLTHRNKQYSSVPKNRSSVVIKSTRGLDDLVEDEVLNESEEILEDQSDDDWDMVMSADAEGEEKNGGTGRTLFARGVVDKYKLLVRKRDGSTTTPVKRPGSRMRANRNESDFSNSSALGFSDSSAGRLSPFTGRPTGPSRTQSENKLKLNIKKSKSRRSLKSPEGKRLKSPLPMLRSGTPNSDLTLTEKGELRSASALSADEDGRIKFRPKFKVTKRLTLNGSLGQMFGSNSSK